MTSNLTFPKMKISTVEDNQGTKKIINLKSIVETKEGKTNTEWMIRIQINFLLLMGNTAITLIMN